MIFIVTPGEIFSHLCHTGTWQSTKWHCHRCISEDSVISLLLLKQIRLHLGYKGLQRVLICLTYARDRWGVIGPVIHGESKSQATRSSSDHVGVHTLSTIGTQGSKLRVRLVLEVLDELMVRKNWSWEFPKVGARLILEVHLILERRRYSIFEYRHGEYQHIYQCQIFLKRFTGLMYKIILSCVVISDVYRSFIPNKTTFAW